MVTADPSACALLYMEQQELGELPEQPAAPAGPCREEEEDKRLKIRLPDRRQSVFACVDLENLIMPDHKARAITMLVEQRIDTQRFYAKVKSREGAAGCAKLDPKMLLSILVYAYSEGIGSMRLVSRLMGQDPGLMWLSGLNEISHTVLSDFRREHQAALQDVFTQMLVLLDEAGLMSLEQVTVDGMRVRAYAGVDTFRRKPSLERKLEKAREWVKQLEQNEDQQYSEQARMVARKRAAAALQQRLEECQKQLEEANRNKSEAEQEETRISTSEPEARRMRMADGGFQPAHNVQLMTDALEKVIVNVEVSNSGQDGEHLESALDGVQQSLERKPKQVLADAAYITHENIGLASQREIELIGPLPDTSKQTQAGLKKRGIDAAFGPSAFLWDEGQQVFRCPENQALPLWGQHTKDRHRKYDVYRAAVEDCSRCRCRAQCVGQDQARVLMVLQKKPELVAHETKMATGEAQTTYKKRGEVAEFPHAWLKDKIGLRKFRLRGLARAGIEALWACLTYNVMIWRRLVWLPQLRQAL